MILVAVFVSLKNIAKSLKNPLARICDNNFFTNVSLLIFTSERKVLSILMTKNGYIIIPA